MLRYFQVACFILLLAPAGQALAVYQFERYWPNLAYDMHFYGADFFRDKISSEFSDDVYSVAALSDEGNVFWSRYTLDGRLLSSIVVDPEQFTSGECWDLPISTALDGLALRDDVLFLTQDFSNLRFTDAVTLCGFDHQGRFHSKIVLQNMRNSVESLLGSQAIDATYLHLEKTEDRFVVHGLINQSVYLLLTFGLEVRLF